MYRLSVRAKTGKIMFAKSKPRKMKQSKINVETRKCSHSGVVNFWHELLKREFQDQ